MSILNHINNAGTNLTSNISAGATTSPVNSVPSISAPFYAILDATNINSKYEVVLITGKTATNINHAATTYAHTTAEEVRFALVAAEADALWDNDTTGWFAAPTGVTLAYSSADDPTYVVTTSSDIRTYVQVGDRVKFTNNSTTFYGIVTAIDATTMTLYGGTTYDVANSAITAVYFSHMKSPVGFSTSKSLWTVETTDTSNQTQATPSASTWYNPGSLSISLPIGAWEVSYQAIAQIYESSNAATLNISMALSTANNSASDADLSIQVARTMSAASLQIMQETMNAHKLITVAAKTPYYLNVMTTIASTEQINIKGDSRKTIIRAVCAYL